MSRTPSVTRIVAAALITCCLSVSACSVSTNEDPVAAGNLFQDFVQSTTTTTSTSTPENATKSEPVYFLRSSEGATRLWPVDRDFDLGADLQAVLDNLFEVPPDGEERPAERGLTTAIPESAVLSSASLASSTSSELVIDVTGLFGSLDGTPLRNALAQIVWTATESNEVRSVSFWTDGEPRSAIIGNGDLVERPVDRRDYTTLG